MAHLRARVAAAPRLRMHRMVLLLAPTMSSAAASKHAVILYLYAHAWHSSLLRLRDCVRPVHHGAGAPCLHPGLLPVQAAAVQRMPQPQQPHSHATCTRNAQHFFPHKGMNASTVVQLSSNGQGENPFESQENFLHTLLAGGFPSALLLGAARCSGVCGGGGSCHCRQLSR